MLQRRPRFEETTDLCILAKSIFWRNRFELDLPLRYEQKTSLPFNYSLSPCLRASVVSGDFRNSRSPCLCGKAGFSQPQIPPCLRASVVSWVFPEVKFLRVSVVSGIFPEPKFLRVSVVGLFLKLNFLRVSASPWC